MEINKNIFLILTLLFFLTSCSETPKSNQVHDAMTLKQLISKTLKDMKFVNGGSFMMGYLGNYKTTALGPNMYAMWEPGLGTTPAHRVILNSYSISKYETTFAEYDTYTQSIKAQPIEAGFIHPDKKAWKWREGKYPVDGADWYQSRSYCHWLGKVTGLPFKLPTEAQWEFAARSRGLNVPFATNNGTIDLGINYPKYSNNARQVGKFPPNALGLYDMSGNVEEWVSDWYSPTYYKISPQKNPQGPKTGTMKVLRGGSYIESPMSSNVFARAKLNPKGQYAGTGFRCALDSSKPPKELYAFAMSNLQSYLKKGN